MAALAALPIAAILVLMLGARWPAARAGMVGLVLALLVAILAFGYGEVTYAELGPATASGGALLEALFTSLTILWIIFPALMIHGLQVSTGSIDVLRMAMGRLTADPRLIAILVAWFFALFIEGAAGFGTTIALAAPFLVSAGFSRVDAVTIALIGHSVGVSFGAVGTPILPQMATTGLSGQALSAATGIYHGLLGWVMLLVLLILVSRASRVGGRPVWGWGALAAVFFLLPFYFLARFVGPELPTLGGALVGGLLFVGALSFTRGRDAAMQTRLPVLRASAPYLILVGLILVSRLVPPVQELLRALTLSWSWQGFGGSIEPFYHPGTMLLVSFLLGAAWQRTEGGKIVAAILQAGRQLLPVTVALVAMLGLSRVMVHAGMIDSLAEAAAAGAGSIWPLLAPFVGVLGTFVTGSATASNILFTDFQEATAKSLELPVITLLGAQGFGAAVGNIVCPHNIIAGGATVGLSGKEGEILKRTLLPCLAYSALGGGLAFLLVVF
jgi:lactate permease